MNLLDRYLYAVESWLPAAEREDRVAELADDLRSQIEEREEEQGRLLDEEELCGILRACGHPMAVAGRLLPGPGWLEPALWSLYRRVVRVVLAALLPAALALLHLPRLLTSHDRSLVLLDLLKHLVQAEIFAFGVITLVFVLVQRGHGQAVRDRPWDPRRLPEVRDRRRIPRAESATGAAFGVLFLLWWCGSRGWTDLGHLGGGRECAELWESFRSRIFWPVTLLAAANLGLDLTALARPYWTRLRLALHAAVHLALAATLVSALSPRAELIGEQFDRLRGAGAPLGQAAAERAAWTVVALGSAALVAVVVTLVAAVSIVRLLIWKQRRAPGGTRLARTTTP